MSADLTFDYEALAQDAMRGMVKTILQRVAKTGLPGEHHFYISFDTTNPSVTLSKRLKDKYPAEMTIVLQHRFWDLAVHDDRFEVKLTFDGIPERLVIPFAAVKVFFDPSVRYGLQFEDPEAETGDAMTGGFGAPARDGSSRAMVSRSSGPRKPRSPAKKSKAEKDGDRTEPASTAAPGAKAPPSAQAHGPSHAKPDAANKADDTAPVSAPAGGPSSRTPSGAQVVRLDQFRKK